MTKPKTRKVRILVAVSPNGSYCAWGASWARGKDWDGEIMTEQGDIELWIDAVVPVPLKAAEMRVRGKATPRCRR